MLRVCSYNKDVCCACFIGKATRSALWVLAAAVLHLDDVALSRSWVGREEEQWGGPLAGVLQVCSGRCRMCCGVCKLSSCGAAGWPLVPPSADCMPCAKCCQCPRYAIPFVEVHSPSLKRGHAMRAARFRI